MSIWILGGSVVVGMVVSAIWVTSWSTRVMGKMNIIDRQGNSYSSKIIDPRQADEYRMKNFIYKYAHFAYQYDPNNIESNIKMANTLGDKSVGIYTERHRQDNTYKEVINMGEIVSINELEVLQNTQIIGDSFQSTFIQTILKNAKFSYKKIQISGKITLVSPSHINENGYFIYSFVEQISDYMPVED